MLVNALQVQHHKIYCRWNHLECSWSGICDQLGKKRHEILTVFALVKRDEMKFHKFTFNKYSLRDGLVSEGES